jgi:hypothetical protein
MGIIRLLAAPVRTLVRFPLVQLAFVVGIILLLQSADDNSMFGQIFSGLDKLVDATVKLFSELFEVRSFTRSGLTAGLMIGYVYLACLLILFFLRVATRVLVDFIGWSNAFGLQNAIARERGIIAYRAWVPLERIRPNNIPQKSGKRHLLGRPTISPPIRR